MPTVSSSRLGSPYHQAAAEARAAAPLSTRSWGTGRSPTGRSTATAAAPRSIASPTKSCPSTRSPRTATNRLPGSTSRESSRIPRGEWLERRPRPAARRPVVRAARRAGPRPAIDRAAPRGSAPTRAPDQASAPGPGGSARFSPRMRRRPARYSCRPRSAVRNASAPTGESARSHAPMYATSRPPKPALKWSIPVPMRPHMSYEVAPCSFEVRNRLPLEQVVRAGLGTRRRHPAVRLHDVRAAANGQEHRMHSTGAVLGELEPALPGRCERLPDPSERRRATQRQGGALRDLAHDLVELVECVGLRRRVDVADDDPVRTRLVDVLAPLLAELGPERFLLRRQVDDPGLARLHVVSPPPAGPEQRGLRLRRFLDLRVHAQERRTGERPAAPGCAAQLGDPSLVGFRLPRVGKRPPGGIREAPRQQRDRSREDLGAEWPPRPRALPDVDRRPAGGRLDPRPGARLQVRRQRMGANVGIPRLGGERRRLSLARRHPISGGSRRACRQPAPRGSAAASSSAGARP